MVDDVFWGSLGQRIVLDAPPISRWPQRSSGGQLEQDQPRSRALEQASGRARGGPFHLAGTSTRGTPSWPVDPVLARSSVSSSSLLWPSLERAGEDPEARSEFLELSASQIERLDWLAQNLLELSKLDSGLVLLDLRPDDLRAAVNRRRISTMRWPSDAGSRWSSICQRPDPDPPRSAAHRPGRRQPRRQCRQVHAEGRRRAHLGRSRSRMVRASMWRTRAWASTPRSCRASSNASTAGPGRTRPVGPGAVSGWPSFARSSICTGAP